MHYDWELVEARRPCDDVSDGQLERPYDDEAKMTDWHLEVNEALQGEAAYIRRKSKRSLHTTLLKTFPSIGSLRSSCARRRWRSGRAGPRCGLRGTA